jgi:CMP-N-acetylneuraminic acid synthetase
MKDTVAALVPMKAHSERVPRKNLRTFNGRPLFHWILATLEAVDAVDDIIVNTDSETIATEAPDLFDVTILDRPADIRGDEVPMNDILLHDVEQVDADFFLQTHCTNPLLRPETVAAAIDAYRFRSCDSLFAVTPFKTRFWTDDGEPVNHERDRLIPTQQLMPLHEENSNIYIFTPDSLRERENRIGDDPTMFEMQQQEAVDIDEMIDFRIAELLHEHIYGDSPDPKTIASMERPPEMEA